MILKFTRALLLCATITGTTAFATDNINLMQPKSLEYLVEMGVPDGVCLEWTTVEQGDRLPDTISFSSLENAINKCNEAVRFIDYIDAVNPPEMIPFHPYGKGVLFILNNEIYKYYQDQEFHENPYFHKNDLTPQKVVGVEVESYEIQQLKKTIKDGTVQQLLRCHLTLKKPMVYKNYPNESETVWSFAPDKGTNFSHLLHEGQFLFPGSNTKLRSLRDTLNILAPNEPA